MSLRPHTSSAASLACSDVRPFQPMTLAQCLAFHFVSPGLGGSASKGIWLSVQNSSHILESLLTDPAPINLPL